MNNNISCIQRRCGERTQDAYLSSLREFCEINLVCGSDLMNAAMQSLKKASTRKRGWTLFIDADVCLYKGTFNTILSSLKDLPPNVYQIKFALDDYITGETIYGVHLHRNYFVGKAYQWFSDRGERGLKSESKNIKAFQRANNLITVTSPYIIGNHDCEQYFCDIIIKYIIIGLRKRRIVNELIQNLIVQREDECEAKNKDITVAIAGLEYSKKLLTNLNASRSICNGVSLIKKLGLREKAPLIKFDEILYRKKSFSDL